MSYTIEYSSVYCYTHQRAEYSEQKTPNVNEQILACSTSIMTDSKGKILTKMKHGGGIWMDGWMVGRKNG